MNSTATRPVPPVAPRFFFKSRAVAAVLVLVSLMAGGSAGGQELTPATKIGRGGWH